MDSIPVPHDIQLQLPLPEGTLKILLVFLFMLHILFVNFMFGGVALSFIFEIMGISNKRYDHLAREISKTVTVNKSLAVVLGVAPLLAINLAYTTYFYASTSLTGIAWVMIIPSVSVAFLLTYLHKYTWDKLADNKLIHLTIAGVALALFMVIPLIFLANVNLMLFPSRWLEVKGFISAVLLQNVIPRYMHFILAAIAVTALFGAGWFGRKKYPHEEKLPGFTRSEVKRLFYKIAFMVTSMQFIVGPLLLLTLPVHGLHLTVYLFIGLGITGAILFMLYVWNELHSQREFSNGRFWIIIILLTCTVTMMAFGRHYYRERAVDPHRKMVAEKTELLYWQAEAARGRERMGISKAPKATGAEAAFARNCGVCHAPTTVMVGPSLKEIIELYPDNPQQVVLWAKNPQVKRGGPIMPSMAHLGDAQLTEIADYILGLEL